MSTSDVRDAKLCRKFSFSSTRECTMDPTLQQKCVQRFNKQFHQDVHELRPLQSLTINHLLKKEDTICMLPTGYGKSLIYEILPTAVNVCHGEDEKTLVLIVAPLNVIIEQELRKLGPVCKELTTGNVKEVKMEISKLQFNIAHPEAVVRNKELNELLSSLPPDIQTFIVIDEAHCVLEWGSEFRPAYHELSALRILLPNAPVLAMSATLTVDSQQQLADSLHLRKPQSVLERPAHASTFLSIKQRSADTMEAIEPLLVELIVQKQDFPLTVVYFNGSQNWVGLAYEFSQRFLGEKMYAGDHQDLQHARVVQFHASVDKGEDEEVTDNSCDDNFQSFEGDNVVRKIIWTNLSRDPAESPLKMVFATSALGMGADLQNVVRVVNVGTPKTVEAYVQQTGRAGRGGDTSAAIMYYNNQDLGVPAVTDTMRAMCRNTTECRQSFLNKCFGFPSPSEPCSSGTIVHCCDICFSQFGVK
ncbi:uncharacterized protein [Littorina saxatilis]|uniref:uncharacterized protein n=1 Tax=Littorina saxatilis TaxID=31220 RepID=UPI0038B543B1